MNLFGGENRRIPQHKMEAYLKFCEVVAWGRRNPVHFVSRFFGLDLLDYQKYVFMESWTKPFVMWLKCRNAGKTVLGAPFIMAKSVLIPNFQTYLLAGVGSQSKEMFMKIEKVAKRELASFTGLTDVFINEVVKNHSDTDGFTHNPNSYQYKLFNGSATNTLNSSPDALRSKRSNLNFYDESGFTPEDVFINSKPFLTQNADFKLGGGIDNTLFPRAFPNQMIFASSASGEDTYFYQQYREFSMRMLMGDKNYFVADINSDVVMNATYNGKIHTPSLLTREVIDEEMRRNPQKAMREYKNIFDTDGGDAQVIKRATIVKNSTLRPPILFNNTGDKFLMAYDPARSFDNSVMLVAKLLWDEKKGYHLELCNAISFTDKNTKKKTPLRYPEQRKLIRQYLLDYNGTQAPEYERIEMLLIDAGSGGGGVQFGDELMEDWVDINGDKHKGIIDMTNQKSSIHKTKFPNAANKVRLIEPYGNIRRDLFEAMIEMVSHDLVTFTDAYSGKSSLVFDKLEDNGKKDERGQIQYDVQESVYKLSFDEQMSLVQLDLLKEEVVNIYRYDNTTRGRVYYGLAPDKKNTMNDDRVYCLSMLCWYLQQLRHKSIVQKPKAKFDSKKIFSSYRKVNPYGR